VLKLALEHPGYQPSWAVIGDDVALDIARSP
jgi:hypothetical protein